MSTTSQKSSAPVQNQGNKPIITIRDSGCVVSVFANPRKIKGKPSIAYRCTFSRRESSGDGSFVTKYSFRSEDLDRLVNMIQDAKQQIDEHSEGSSDIAANEISQDVDVAV